jgi:hypothetical protein
VVNFISAILRFLNILCESYHCEIKIILQWKTQVRRDTTIHIPNIDKSLGRLFFMDVSMRELLMVCVHWRSPHSYIFWWNRKDGRKASLRPRLGHTMVGLLTGPHTQRAIPSFPRVPTLLRFSP